MRKIIFLAYIMAGMACFGQMPINGDYSNWNWENNTNLDNWKRANPSAPDGSGWSRINPPFHPETDRVGLLDDIYVKQDYKNSDGWELIWARFGPSEVNYPYFILCNKYRGIIRAYIYIKDVPYSKISVSLSYHNESKRAGILIYGNNKANATDKYWNATATDDDMITSIIPKVGTDAWGVAEFPIFFDGNIRGNGTGEDKYEGSKWEFDFWAIDNYNIKPEDSDIIDPVQNGQHYIVGNSSIWPQTEGSSFSAANAQIIKDFGNFTTLANAMKESAKEINDNSPQFLKDYKKGSEEFFTAVSAVSTKLQLIAGFVKFFKGFFGNEEKNGATQPKATSEQINLKGSMTLARKLGGTSLKVLGVNPNPNDPPLIWQPFDCPIGYLNLKKTPTITASREYIRYPYTSSYPDWNGVQSAYNGGYRKYKLEEDIEVIFNNQIPGAILEDLQFALVFNPNGTGPTSFNTESKKGTLYRIQDEYINYHWMDALGNAQIVPLKNPVYDALLKGYFIVHHFNSSDPTKTYFGTPFIEKNKLKNIIFELPSFTEISLAVLAKIKLDNFPEPIVIKKYYKVDKRYLTIPVSGSNDYFVKNLNEQMCCFPLSTYYQCELKKTISTTTSSSYMAGEIVMEVGFIGNLNFIAHSCDPYPYFGNTLIAYPGVSFDCYSNLKSTSFNDFNIEGIENYIFEDTYDVHLYPNPASNYIEIIGSHEIISVEFINSLGYTVKIYRNLDSTSVLLNIEDLVEGIYFVKIITIKDQSIKKLHKSYVY